MKKSLLICLVLTSTRCFSQNFMQSMMQRLSFGIKAGANYSNYVNADFNTQAVAGYHAGALVDFKLTNNLAIQEEFLFSSQGAKVQEELFGKQDINVYYMSVPFLLKYRTNSGIYIEAGPQVDMRIKDNIPKTQTGDFAKQMSFAAAGGIGFQSKSGLGIGARYVAGLSDVGNFQPSTIKPDFRNSVVQVSVFYIF